MHDTLDVLCIRLELIIADTLIDLRNLLSRIDRSCLVSSPGEDLQSHSLLLAYVGTMVQCVQEDKPVGE